MTPARSIGQNWLPSIFNDIFENNLPYLQSSKSPAINIIERENGYELELAAPGMTKNEFKLTVDTEGDLIIKMEKKTEENSKDKDGHYLRREFSYSKFQQTILLPENADKEKISAKMENGVLFVNIPKIMESLKEEKEKLIEIL